MATSPGAAKWAAGLVCILVVAVLWTFATVLKQVIFQDLHFNEPLTLTYVCNACYMVHLPLHVLGRSLGLVPKVPWRLQADRDTLCDGASAGAQSSVVEAACIGTAIAPLWFAAQWSYSEGVALTSVTNSTVISTTSVVWTLLASVIFLGERLNLLKVFGIALCIAGNVATLFGNAAQGGEHGGGGRHVKGDLLCSAAAIFYAAYTTVLKRFAHPEISVALMFGTLGLVVAVAGFPLPVLLDISGLRCMTPQIFGLLMFNGIFDNVLTQYAWAKGVQWTSPTAATAGLSLTLPLGVLADWARRRSLNLWSYVAAVLVLVGFLAVTLGSKPAGRGHNDAARPSAMDHASACAA
mmetsp:Transcript_113807/g.321867  ORF Transcript_113807/g.321867 Transcript_113807/m.321867 type:complete len:352 (+) Transcript_113807:60-1115(+)